MQIAFERSQVHIPFTIFKFSVAFECDFKLQRTIEGSRIVEHVNVGNVDERHVGYKEGTRQLRVSLILNSRVT